MDSDAWRRQFPTPAVLDVVDAFADLVARRTAELLADQAPAERVERTGFSPKEAAVYLGVGEATVTRLIKAGTIHPAKLGARTVIHRAQLDRLLGEQVAS